MATASAKDAPIHPSELEGKPLGKHDGVKVTDVSAKIAVGDVIKETMKISPIHIPMGARVMVLVPARCVSHEYDFITEGRGAKAVELADEYQETALLKAEAVILLDPDLVQEVVDAHMARVIEARAAAREDERRTRGEGTLPGTGVGDLPPDDGE